MNTISVIRFIKLMAILRARFRPNVVEVVIDRICHETFFPTNTLRINLTSDRKFYIGLFYVMKSV